jgi:hypothetical protein
MRSVGKPTVHGGTPRGGIGGTAPFAPLFNGALVGGAAQSALAAASTSSACPRTLTFSQMRAILPSGPIR